MDAKEMHDPSILAAEIARALSMSGEERDALLQKIADQALSEWLLPGAASAIKQMKEWLQEKTQLYVRMAEQYLEIDERAKGLNALAHARAESTRIKRDWARAESLNLLARALSKYGETQAANQVWEEAIKVGLQGEHDPSIQHANDASKVLCDIAQDLAIAGYFDRAHSVLDEMKRGYWGANARLRIGAMTASKAQPGP